MIIVRKYVNKFIHWTATQKYRIDLGFTMMTLLNFALLILANSEKIQSIWNINTYVLVILSLPAGLFTIWLIGYCMERFKFRARQNEMAAFNNPILMEMVERLRRIEENQQNDKKNI